VLVAVDRVRVVFEPVIDLPDPAAREHLKMGSRGKFLLALIFTTLASEGELSVWNVRGNLPVSHYRTTGHNAGP